MRIPKKVMDNFTPATRVWAEEHPTRAAAVYYTGAATPYALLLGTGYLIGRVLIKALR